MHELRRKPEVARVALITLTRSHKVPLIRARRRRTVVTRIAGSGDRIVIDIGRHPGRLGMTVVALRGGLNVQPVLAGRIHAIMTAGACARHHRPVIEHRGNPCIGRVTVIAISAAFDMPRILACREAAVVATRTGTQHLQVINTGRR